MEAANLAAFLKFGKAKNQKFVLSLQKIIGGHETGGLEQNWGPVLPRPGPKTATGDRTHRLSILCLYLQRCDRNFECKVVVYSHARALNYCIVSYSVDCSVRYSSVSTACMRLQSLWEIAFFLRPEVYKVV